MQVAGKVVVVTGAANGIGKALAERFAADGARVVAVADPRAPTATIDTVRLAAGAVASSWRTKRAWTAPDGTARHHLIDPWTDDVSTTDLASVTVVARSGWLAEAHATAAILAGSDHVIDHLDRHQDPQQHHPTHHHHQILEKSNCPLYWEG